MVNSHALMLVPSSKLSCFAQAFIMVSWTRSSALSCRPDSENAKALRLGSVARRSRLKDGVSAGVRSAMRSILRAGRLRLPLDFVELVEQVEQPVRDRLVLNGAVERPQLHANVGIRPEAIFPAPPPGTAKMLHIRL